MVEQVGGGELVSFVFVFHVPSTKPVWQILLVPYAISILPIFLSNRIPLSDMLN